MIPQLLSPGGPQLDNPQNKLRRREKYFGRVSQTVVALRVIRVEAALTHGVVEARRKV